MVERERERGSQAVLLAKRFESHGEGGIGGNPGKTLAKAGETCLLTSVSHFEVVLGITIMPPEVKG